MMSGGWMGTVGVVGVKLAVTVRTGGLCVGSKTISVAALLSVTVTAP
jgi:hypothetical protein